MTHLSRSGSSRKVFKESTQKAELSQIIADKDLTVEFGKRIFKLDLPKIAHAEDHSYAQLQLLITDLIEHQKDYVKRGIFQLDLLTYATTRIKQSIVKHSKFVSTVADYFYAENFCAKTQAAKHFMQQHKEHKGISFLESVMLSIQGTRTFHNGK